MYDFVIVGSGWNGLSFAKKILEIEGQSINIVVLDKGSSVGGVWAKDKIYSCLYAQSVHSLFEYPDFPMQDNTAHQKNKYLAGSAIHEYLTDYAKRFNIYPRIRFGTCVSEARRDDEVGGWALKTTNSSGTEVLRCRKLVIATGPTSNPFIPRIPSAESHSYPIIHSSQLPQYSDSPSFMGTISRVTVVGGAKSSFDSVYAFMKEGKHVDWVIRPDGSGPASIYPPTIFGIKTINISCTRLFSAFSPNLYGLFEHDWCYRFLHRSIIGALLVSHFWIIVTWMCNWHAGYRRSQNAEKLRPSPNSMFWANGGLGLMSCGMGFWELFHSGKATVYRESITSMEETSVTLSSARKLPTDLVVFCTGYNDDITTLSRPLQESLGLPNREYETTYPSDNKELDELADEVVKISFPALANTPKTIRLPRTQRKSPLYRRMISPQTANDIVFMGQIHTIATPILAHVQALWAVAFLTGRLSIPSRTVMEEEIALWNAWTKRRYLSQGYKLPYSIYDFHSYVDTLLRDLGLNPLRKPNIFKEFLEPYRPRDYRGIVEEWINTRHGL